jgi:hypothetical protein
LRTVSSTCAGPSAASCSSSTASPPVSLPDPTATPPPLPSLPSPAPRPTAGPARSARTPSPPLPLRPRALSLQPPALPGPPPPQPRSRRTPCWFVVGSLFRLDPIAQKFESTRRRLWQVIVYKFFLHCLQVFVSELHVAHFFSTAHPQDIQKQVAMIVAALDLSTAKLNVFLRVRLSLSLFFTLVFLVSNLFATLLRFPLPLSSRADSGPRAATDGDWGGLQQADGNDP